MSINQDFNIEAIKYNMYEAQVLSRAAHSIGCLPVDLTEYEYHVLSMYVDGLTESEAAIMVEHCLQGECYYYTKVEPFMEEVNSGG
jgi:hypothetical protein